MSSATVCSTTTRGSWNTACALGHAGDEPEARQPQRPGAAQPAAPSAVDQPGAGDHLRQDHRDGLQRLDLDILVAARLGMLDREHADRAFEPDDRDAGEAVEALFAGLGLVEEGRVLGGLGEVEDAPFGGDRADQAFAHPQPGDVHRFLAQAMGGEQLEVVVAQQVDRADVAIHLLGDEVDDLVELGLRRTAPGHDRVEAGQDLAGGGGGGERHEHAANRCDRARVTRAMQRKCFALALSGTSRRSRHPLRFSCFIRIRYGFAAASASP